jgi:DNA-binding response OmpR family regulator
VKTLQTILIVDADSQLLRLLRSELTSRFHILTAANGEEGLIMALIHKPDLIMSDVNTPELNGWELCYLLRQIPSTRTIPFVFLTSQAELPDKIKARQVGADDFIAKPLSIDELGDRLVLIFERIHTPKSLITEVGVTNQQINIILLDLLDFLQSTRRSGVIQITDTNTSGYLSVAKGSVVEAQCGELTGEPALRLMVENRLGEVAFKEGAVEQRAALVVDWNAFLLSVGQKEPT